MPLDTHAFASSGAKAWDSNGILECKFLSENARRTEQRRVRDEAARRLGHSGEGGVFHVLLQCLDAIDGDNGKSSGLPRGMSLVTRMFELQANMRGIQWHPRV
jgi:hypothetical protein